MPLAGVAVETSVAAITVVATGGVAIGASVAVGGKGNRVAARVADASGVGEAYPGSCGMIKIIQARRRDSLVRLLAWTMSGYLLPLP